jgi:hypothetical protein
MAELDVLTMLVFAAGTCVSHRICRRSEDLKRLRQRNHPSETDGQENKQMSRSIII